MLAWTADILGEGRVRLKTQTDEGEGLLCSREMFCSQKRVKPHLVDLTRGCGCSQTSPREGQTLERSAVQGGKCTRYSTIMGDNWRRERA